MRLHGWLGINQGLAPPATNSSQHTTSDWSDSSQHTTPDWSDSSQHTTPDWSDSSLNTQRQTD